MGRVTRLIVVALLFFPACQKPPPCKRNLDCGNLPHSQADVPLCCGGKCMAVRKSITNCTWTVTCPNDPNGESGLTCARGSGCCNGLCTDLDSPQHCGSCTNVCGNNETCSSGKCCPSGTTACNGVCSDTSSDLFNCGACGNACPSCSTCTKGKCGPCASCQKCDGKQCVSACPAGQICKPGIGCGPAGPCGCASSAPVRWVCYGTDGQLLSDPCEPINVSATMNGKPCFLWCQNP